MISVAGVRGIVGESLTPPVVARFAAAFARSLGTARSWWVATRGSSGPVVHARGGRGPRGAGATSSTSGSPRRPRPNCAVEHLHAAGGVILTASHNPAPWNALKFLSARGEFLGARRRRVRVRARFEADGDFGSAFDVRVANVQESEALAWHLDAFSDSRCSTCGDPGAPA